MTTESNEALLADGECPVYNCIEPAGHNGRHTNWAPAPDFAYKSPEQLINEGYVQPPTPPADKLAELDALLSECDTTLLVDWACTCDGCDSIGAARPKLTQAIGIVKTMRGGAP